MSEPLAYFLTFTTYGSWLHGRDPGSVDRQHNVVGTPFLSPDSKREARIQDALRQDAYFLDATRREIALRTIREVCEYRKWNLWAAHVRTTHVHVVLTAAAKPERVMSDLKAWTSRRIREECGERHDRDRWTQHGSTRWLNSEETVSAAIRYVVDEQGDNMAVFDGRCKEPGNYPG